MVRLAILLRIYWIVFCLLIVLGAYQLFTVLKHGNDYVIDTLMMGVPVYIAILGGGIVLEAAVYYVGKAAKSKPE